MEQQEQELMDRLTELERRFQELVIFLEDGSHPWGMMKASRVTGFFRQEKLPRLELSLENLINVYQYYPQVLASVAFRVGLTPESYWNPQSRNIALEKTGNGNYWVIATLPESYWLVPRDTIKINDRVIEIVESLFECKGYENSQTHDFILIKPARVSPSQDGKLWVLEELGKLDFTRRSPEKTLREELQQLKTRIQHLEAKDEDIYQELWVFEQKFNHLIGSKQQEVRQLQQQLERANQERQELTMRVEFLFDLLKQQGLLKDESLEDNFIPVKTVKETVLDEENSPFISPETRQETVLDEENFVPLENEPEKEGDTVLEGEEAGDNRDKLENWQGIELIRTLRGHEDTVRTLAVSYWRDMEGEQIIVSGGFDKTIRLWNLLTGELIDTLSEKDRVNKLVLSPHEKIIISASDRSILQVRDLVKGKASSLHSHSGGILALAISFDGELLLSGGRDKMINLWQLSTCKILQTVSLEDSGIYALAISLEGKTIISSNGNRVIKQWSLERKGIKFKRSLGQYSELIWDLSISPDGQLLACSFSNGLIRILSLVTGEILHELIGHSKDIYGIAFSPDGEILASGSSDHTVKLWRAKTGKLKLLETLKHDSDVFAVAFSGDGRFLVSGGRDKLIKVWKLKE